MSLTNQRFVGSTQQELAPLRLEPLKVERQSITIPGLPAQLAPLTIAQLSDFHYDDTRLSERLLIEAIAAANAAHPDLVALTGDFITNAPTPIHRLTPHLSKLQSRYGVVAVLGNHDYYQHQARTIVTEALERIGITVLWNAIAYPFGEQFPVVGLADLWSGDFQPVQVMGQLDPDIPRLVLSHNPDSAVPLRRWRVDLQLSGHTHGGQIVLPNGEALPSFLLRLRQWLPRAIARRFWKECTKVILHWEWSQGYHRVGSNQLYVNRGLGTYFPGRWRCPPELTLLQLQSANTSE
ncbi:MAG: metallophosphoesterase [Spirulina sp. SIO3F2]|nr:metallophosphoesterase [Spirulina sp. SIO3F2]